MDAEDINDIDALDPFYTTIACRLRGKYEHFIVKGKLSYNYDTPVLTQIHDYKTSKPILIGITGIGSVTISDIDLSVYKNEFTSLLDLELNPAITTGYYTITNANSIKLSLLMYDIAGEKQQDMKTTYDDLVQKSESLAPPVVSSPDLPSRPVRKPTPKYIRNPLKNGGKQFRKTRRR